MDEGLSEEIAMRVFVSLVKRSEVQRTLEENAKAAFDAAEAFLAERKRRRARE